MKYIKVRLTFTEELLGTASANPELHEEFVASRSADKEKMKEEMEALPAKDLVKKVKTIFPKENGVPFLWDYQVKGFFKESCGALRRVKGLKSNKLTAYRKIIDGLIFVEPRKILIKMPKKSVIGDCQRPLRGQTAQGERIALANSETIPAGSFVEFEIKLYDPAHEKLVKEWLEYGEDKGTGQWRNSGKGKFTWKKLK